MLELYSKAYRIIVSCQTIEHIKAASRFLKLVEKEGSMYVHLFDRLNNRLLEQLDIINEQ